MTKVTDSRQAMGRALEDYEIGEIICHWPGRTITEYENQLFTLLTGNPSSSHVDRLSATEHGHPDMLVNGGYILALVHGLSTREISTGYAAIYHLGMDDVRILRPSYPGDTLRVFSKVVETRPSSSKPDRGILTVQTWAENQRGERVIQFLRSIMVYRKDFVPEAATGPVTNA